MLNAAIAGIGESRLGQVADYRSALQLQAHAARAALADAGLALKDVGGLLTTPLRVEQWIAAPAGPAPERIFRPSFSR